MCNTYDFLLLGYLILCGIISGIWTLKVEVYINKNKRNLNQLVIAICVRICYGINFRDIYCSL